VSESTAKLLPESALLEAGALALKGKSTRTKLFAVVGDERLGKSADFKELRVIHGQLVEALRSRSVTSRKIISSAKLRAAGLTAELPEFYRRISRRSEHFLDEPKGRDVSSAE